MVHLRTLFLTALLFFLAACDRRPAKNPSPTTPGFANASNQIFTVKGAVKAVKSGGKVLEVRHEAIPDYMPAMTMPFDVKNTNEAVSRKPGDSISFRLTVTVNDSWIDQIKKLEPVTNSVSTTNAVGGFRKVADVEALQ